MSTAKLFKVPRMTEVIDELARVDEHRNRLQVRNAELILALQLVQTWLQGNPSDPRGWDGIRELINDTLDSPPAA